MERKKKGVRYSTTEIDETKTVGEIMRMLAEFGVTDMSQAWEDGRLSVIRFTLTIHGRPFSCVMRAPYATVRQHLTGRSLNAPIDKVAIRTAWRRVYYLLEQILLAAEDRLFPAAQLLLGFMEAEHPHTGERVPLVDLLAEHGHVGSSGALLLAPRTSEP